MAQKILFIEDDALIVKIYTARLTKDGYEVFTADNGEDGIKIALEKRPDLVVLDVMMPKVDGFGVLEKLRADANFTKVPILLYSNLAQEEELKRALAMGATEFIVKANISPTELVEKIKKYLGNKT
jgi:DNA-binding response OmpR family regulator